MGVSRDHVLQALHPAHTINAWDTLGKDSSELNEEETRNDRQWKQWLDKEVEWLQDELRDVETTSTALRDVMTRTQRVLNVVTTQRHLLDSYVTTLPRLRLSDVTNHNSDMIFHVTLPDDGVSVPLSLDGLQQRLRHIVGHYDRSSVAADVKILLKTLKGIRRILGKFAIDLLTDERDRIVST
jgi:hypothetical protein